MSSFVLPLLPRFGGNAGEVVKVFRRGSSSWLVSLAVRGGLGRSCWVEVFSFWWRCGWWSSSSSLLWPAVVARGAGAWRLSAGVGGGPGWRRVGGKWGGAVERALRPCTFIVFGFRRAAADGSAVIYKAWRCLLPGGRRYGGAGVA